MEALKTLPYIQHLLDPPQSLLDVLYKEYSLIVACESAASLEKRQEQELKSLEAQKAKALKDEKDAISHRSRAFAKLKAHLMFKSS